MLSHPHCPDTNLTLVDFVPTDDEDWYIDGVLPSDPGDYLNTFEEYRGFYCQGIHTRTVPWDKDFFIYSDLDDSVTFYTGIGWADSIGPGLGHWINQDEMRHYEEPDPQHFLPIWARSVNWLAERIQNHDTCACAIVLNNTDWDSASMHLPIGESHFLNPNYFIPRTTLVSYIFTNRIKSHTPPNINDTTTVDMPQDSLCYDHVSGHEIGHIVNLRHNPTDITSIMFEYLIDFLHPTWQYKQADIDSFLVKPPQ